MTSSRLRVALLLVLAFAVAACSPRLVGYRGYRGDGQFIAHAAPSILCQDGYTVDLGPIDPNRMVPTRFTLDGLPPIEAMIGLAVTTEASESPEWPAAQIAVTLRDENGAIVLSRQEPLASWRSEYALADPARKFLYQQGTQIEVYAGPGAIRVERFPIGADDSWGTYFTPRRGARYTLLFDVATPDAGMAGISARLQLRGAAGCL